ncbi:hypothetical protein BA190_09495 [Labrys sp. WJW]|uniref:hypothetical protein n=1 Tax=Labrys sp. WJW TaxID=1737983 RepID=UPI00082C3E72|nr:hypothetical protein [Labrys sp. WJW]OCC05140.1 hypothetical protein BA190_09495 [Labrys sp. WJW]
MEEKEKRGARAYALACRDLEQKILQVFTDHANAIRTAVHPDHEEHTVELVITGGVRAMFCAAYHTLACVSFGEDAQRRAEIRQFFYEALADIEASRKLPPVYDPSNVPEVVQ